MILTCTALGIWSTYWGFMMALRSSSRVQWYLLVQLLESGQHIEALLWPWDHLLESFWRNFEGRSLESRSIFQPSLAGPKIGRYECTYVYKYKCVQIQVPPLLGLQFLNAIAWNITWVWGSVYQLPPMLTALLRVACAFIRSWWRCTFWMKSLMTLNQRKNRKLRHNR